MPIAQERPADYREPVVVAREPARYRETTVNHGMLAAYRAAQTVYLVFGIVEALLVIRLILKLLAANPTAGFSNLIYGITDPLVTLFQGVFPSVQSSRSVLDLAAILAIIVYALVAWGIVRLIWIMQRGTGDSTRFIERS